MEGDQRRGRLFLRNDISIHALRVEGDDAPLVIRYIRNQISIHALRVEGDHFCGTTTTCGLLFLSTPSGWRATLSFQIVFVVIEFLSTPSGWRATQIVRGIRLIFTISIHALRVEGDTEHFNIAIFVAVQFLSTPSGWRATSPNPVSSLTVPISIHALRVEGDSCGSIVSIPPPKYFYPRPPGGGRLHVDRHG